MDEDFIVNETQTMRAEIAHLQKELAAAKAVIAAQQDNSSPVETTGIIIVIRKL